MNKLLLLCGFSLFLLSSCQKKADELPEATQTGANTFGAKVNGEFWVPQGFGVLPANDILSAYMGGDDLRINARNFSKSPTETEFIIYVMGVTRPGVYHLNSTVSHISAGASYAYYVKRKFTPLDEWMTNATTTGTVTITFFDPVNRIVSGTFEFNMQSLSGTSTMNVTEGRFDLKLQ